MVDPNTAKFINSLAKYLQMFCHGYMEFADSIEIVGHINVRIDNSRKHDYIVNEQVSKRGQESTFFQSNSYHSLPPSKDENGEKEQRLPGKSDDSIVVNYHHMLDSPVAPLDSGLQADVSGPAPVTSASHSDDFNGTTSNSHRRSISRDSQISLVEEEQLSSSHAQKQGFNHSSINPAESEEMEHESSGPGEQTHSAISQAVFSDNDRPGQHTFEQNQNVIVKAEPDDQYFAPDTSDQDERFKTSSTVASATSSILASCQQTFSSVPVTAASSSSSSLLSAHQQPAPAVVPTATASSGQLMLPASAVTYSGFSDAVEHETEKSNQEPERRDRVLVHAVGSLLVPTINQSLLLLTTSPLSGFSVPSTAKEESGSVAKRSLSSQKISELPSTGISLNKADTFPLLSSSSPTLKKQRKEDVHCTVCGTQFRNNKLLGMHTRLVHRKKSSMKCVNLSASKDDVNSSSLVSSDTTSDISKKNESADFPNSSGMHIATESFLELARSRNGSSDSTKKPETVTKAGTNKNGPVACHYCQILFWNNQNLLDHQKLCGQRYSMETGEERCPSLCQTCQRVFLDASTLAEHKKTCCKGQSSAVSSPTTCPICHLPFLDPAMLSAHLWVCGKGGNSGNDVSISVADLGTFVNSSSTIVSSGNSNLNSNNSCDECGKVFQGRTSLVDHINSMHKGMSFTCPDCGEKFKWRTCVYRHKLRCRRGKNVAKQT